MTATAQPRTTSLQRLTLPVLGLTCGGGGALTVERSIARLPGVRRAYVNPATEVAYVEFDPAQCSPADVIAAIERTGFRVIVLDRSPSGLSRLRKRRDGGSEASRRKDAHRMRTGMGLSALGPQHLVRRTTMASSRNTFTALLILTFALLALIAFAAAVGPVDTDGVPNTRYHEQAGTHSDSDPVGGHYRALPAAQDPTSAGIMARSASVMIHVADSMGATTPTLLENGDAATRVLAQHWNLDAHALSDRATWMVTSATSDAMIHNTDNVTAVNLSNLRGNGLAMIDEGRAMARHGAQMRTEVEQLQRDAVLSNDVANHLLDQADALFDAGQALERDGESMRDTANSLLRSIGR